MTRRGGAFLLDGRITSEVYWCACQVPNVLSDGVRDLLAGQEGNDGNAVVAFQGVRTTLIHNLQHLLARKVQRTAQGNHRSHAGAVSFWWISEHSRKHASLQAEQRTAGPPLLRRTAP
jgi:hypothetical protein